MVIEFYGFQPCLGERKLLSPLSARIEKGTFAVLAGPSGAGKSRFLETLMSPLLPHEGHAELRAPSVSVPQSLDLCKSLSAAGNVATARVAETPFWKTLFGFSDEEIKNAHRWLDLMGLEESRKPTFQLSGGEQQRVALARVLNSERLIWLLDEPVSQLDDRAALNCMENVKREAKARGATILCVLHQEKIARAVADRIFLWDTEWRIS